MSNSLTTVSYSKFLIYLRNNIKATAMDNYGNSLIQTKLVKEQIKKPMRAKMVEPGRIELPTYGVQSRRSPS